MVAYGKPSAPQPADGAVGADDTKFLVEDAGLCGLVQVDENADAVVWVNVFPVRKRGIEQAGHRPARDLFKRGVYIDHVFGGNIHHPEDLLDMVGQLMEFLLGIGDGVLGRLTLNNLLG